MWWRRIRYVLLLTALCSLATCPAAHRACVADVESREADELLDYLADRVAARVAATGHVPPDAAGPTPPAGCCEQGGECAVDNSLWETPGWRALAFSIDDPFRYSYRYAPDASGTSATLTAVGDLDCDGEPMTYELRLEVSGDHVTRTRTVTQQAD